MLAIYKQFDNLFQRQISGFICAFHDIDTEFKSQVNRLFFFVI